MKDYSCLIVKSRKHLEEAYDRGYEQGYEDAVNEQYLMTEKELQGSHNSDDIKVGDEVIIDRVKSVILSIRTESADQWCECVDCSGNVFTADLKNCEKTGRSFPEIEKVLEAMRGEE